MFLFRKIDVVVRWRRHLSVIYYQNCPALCSCLLCHRFGFQILLFQDYSDWALLNFLFLIFEIIQKFTNISQVLVTSTCLHYMLATFFVLNESRQLLIPIVSSTISWGFMGTEPSKWLTLGPRRRWSCPCDLGRLVTRILRWEFIRPTLISRLE